MFPRDPLAPGGDQLFDVSEKRRGMHAEGPGEFDDGAKSRFATRPFEQGDLGAMQVASVAERLLREAGCEPRGAQVRRELHDWVHGAECSACADRTSTDKTLRSVLAGVIVRARS
jgi:hypothetical protein